MEGHKTAEQTERNNKKGKDREVADELNNGSEPEAGPGFTIHDGLIEPVDPHARRPIPRIYPRCNVVERGVERSRREQGEAREEIGQEIPLRKVRSIACGIGGMIPCDVLLRIAR